MSVLQVLNVDSVDGDTDCVRPVDVLADCGSVADAIAGKRTLSGVHVQVLSISLSVRQLL